MHPSGMLCGCISATFGGIATGKLVVALHRIASYQCMVTIVTREVNKKSRASKTETNTGLSLCFRKLTTTNLCSTTCVDIVLITLMCNYGHVLHAVHVHEPLWWVERVPMGQKSFLTYQP